jgi:hypothetical protein
MNQQQRAVVQQALEALELNLGYGPDKTIEQTHKAIEVLRQLLEAEPVQSAERGEPVALVVDGVLVKSMLPEKYTGHLYITPPIVATPLAQQANKS